MVTKTTQFTRKIAVLIINDCFFQASAVSMKTGANETYNGLQVYNTVVYNYH